jgi:hypothetical protein
MRTRFVTFVTRDVQATRFAINMRHPPAFARRVGIGDAAFEKAARRLNSVELQRVFGTLVHRPVLSEAVARSDANRVGKG